MRSVIFSIGRVTNGLNINSRVKRVSKRDRNCGKCKLDLDSESTGVPRKSSHVEMFIVAKICLNLDARFSKKMHGISEKCIKLFSVALRSAYNRLFQGVLVFFF